MSDLATLATLTGAARYRLFPARADTMPQSEVILPGLWKQLHDEGIFGMFFHEHPDLTFGQFVQVLSNPSEIVEFVCEMADDNETIVKVAAIAMLTQITRTDIVKRAMGNFLLFRDYWNHKDSDIVGNVILRHWYVDLELNTIVGVTPKLNRAALQFVHRMGFQTVGEIPSFTSYFGDSCDGVITCQSFKQWDARQQHG